MYNQKKREKEVKIYEVLHLKDFIFMSFMAFARLGACENLIQEREGERELHYFLYPKCTRPTLSALSFLCHAVLLFLLVDLENLHSIFEIHKMPLPFAYVQYMVIEQQA